MDSFTQQMMPFWYDLHTLGHQRMSAWRKGAPVQCHRDDWESVSKVCALQLFTWNLVAGCFAKFHLEDERLEPINHPFRKGKSSSQPPWLCSMLILQAVWILRIKADKTCLKQKCPRRRLTTHDFSNTEHMCFHLVSERVRVFASNFSGCSKICHFRLTWLEQC